MKTRLVILIEDSTFNGAAAKTADDDTCCMTSEDTTLGMIKAELEKEDVMAMSALDDDTKGTSEESFTSEEELLPSELSTNGVDSSELACTDIGLCTTGL